MAGIRRFTAAYDRARAATGSDRLSADWAQIRTDKAGIKLVFANAEGPSATQGARLDTLRKMIAEKAKGPKPLGESETISAMVGVGPTSAQAMTGAQADAAATSKLARHLYLTKQAGAQTVWICARPFSFDKWVYDEIRGCTGAEAKPKLGYDNDAYPPATRTHMANGEAQALSWARKCVPKLGDPDAATKALVTT